MAATLEGLLGSVPDLEDMAPASPAAPSDVENDDSDDARDDDDDDNEDDDDDDDDDDDVDDDGEQDDEEEEEEDEEMDEEGILNSDPEENAEESVASEVKKKSLSELGESAGLNLLDTEAPSTSVAAGERNDGKKPSPKKGRKRKAAGTGDIKPKNKSKKKFERRNIRKILSDDKLNSATAAAQAAESARLQRVAEARRQMAELQEAETRRQAQHEAERRKNEQLIRLLEESPIPTPDVPSTSSARGSDDDVIVPDVIELSSDEDDVTTASPLPPTQEEDFDNSGDHVNDGLNVPDESGNVLLNVHHPPEDDDIFLPPQIARVIKPHQIGGVRFLYDNLVESVKNFQSNVGFGCILAHSMGLGKTIQMISFIDTFLRLPQVQTVLCIVPINTLQNWVSEFNRWVPASTKKETSEEQGTENTEEEKEDCGLSTNGDVRYRNYGLYIINENHRTTNARATVVANWRREGGALLVGYEMYRLLVAHKKPPRLKPQAKRKVVVDLEEEDRNKERIDDMMKALIEPGPDMVVCDEGHRIKNCHSAISTALKNINTRRRVVLTGYPLQNNLIEYWCMVDFVRPMFLGTKNEFSNMFERPITNGQCTDATPEDAKLMKQRAHVLHDLLKGFVQRRSHMVLKLSLPEKREHVLLTRMSAAQRRLYKDFMASLEDPAANGGGTGANALKAFAVCCKIWNHPDVMFKVVKQKQSDRDLDIDLDSTEGTTSKKRRGPVKSKSSPSLGALADPKTLGPDPLIDIKRYEQISYDFSEVGLRDYRAGLLENSGKFALLFPIIEQTLALGEKLLIFSLSLLTLDLLEEFLVRRNIPLPHRQGQPERWARNISYYRLDGSTAGQDRERMINQFNAPDNDKTWLFLLSTKAGCLGINLIGASRVVVLDASWNPCHDSQAICRVYRYGQKRPCHIYRFVSYGTMEKHIYDRQISKQGMSDRIVDELNPDSHITRKQVERLLEWEDKEPAVVDPADFQTDDPVMQHIMQSHSHWLAQLPFSHESLLLDRRESRLSRAEKQQARENYERERRKHSGGMGYSRNSYSAFYKGSSGFGSGMSGSESSLAFSGFPNLNVPSKASLGRSGFSVGRMQEVYNKPVASVRPIMSTPAPRQASRPDNVVVSKNGVVIQKVITTTAIPIPTKDKALTSREVLPAGSDVMVIKTPRGVYIRAKDNRIFAVRGQQGLGMTTASSAPSVVTSSLSQPVSSASYYLGNAPRGEANMPAAFSLYPTSSHAPAAAAAAAASPNPVPGIPTPVADLEAGSPFPRAQPLEGQDNVTFDITPHDRYEPEMTPISPVEDRPSDNWGGAENGSFGALVNWPRPPTSSMHEAIVRETLPPFNVMPGSHMPPPPYMPGSYISQAYGLHYPSSFPLPPSMGFARAPQPSQQRAGLERQISAQYPSMSSQFGAPPSFEMPRSTSFPTGGDGEFGVDRMAPARSIRSSVGLDNSPALAFGLTNGSSDTIQQSGSSSHFGASSSIEGSSQEIGGRVGHAVDFGFGDDLGDLESGWGGGHEGADHNFDPEQLVKDLFRDPSVAESLPTLVPNVGFGKVGESGEVVKPGGSGKLEQNLAQLESSS